MNVQSKAGSPGFVAVREHATDVRVLAVDLSLSGTGIACSRPTPWTDTVKVKATGHERMRQLVTHLYDLAATVRLVVIEGPSYGSGTTGRQAGHHERAGLWWLVTHKLWRNDVPVAVVPPAVLKRYATGKGNASKDEVLIAAARRYPGVELADNNQADALTMLAMALDHYGHPIADVPASHRSALGSVDWPEVTL